MKLSGNCGGNESNQCRAADDSTFTDIGFPNKDWVRKCTATRMLHSDYNCGARCGIHRSSELSATYGYLKKFASYSQRINQMYYRKKKRLWSCSLNNILLDVIPVDTVDTSDSFVRKDIEEFGRKVEVGSTCASCAPVCDSGRNGDPVVSGWDLLVADGVAT